MRLSPDARAAGFMLRHVPSIGSTNPAALEALAGGANRFWVVADRQEAGRGRHGRHWESPLGNLHASLGLVAPCSTAEAPRLGFVAGLALADAVLRLAPGLAGLLRLKWPNDCLIAGAKLAGILLEGTMLADGRQGLAIGIGVNVAHCPEIAGRAATTLVAHAEGGAPISAASLFEALSAEMAASLALFADGSGFAEIRRRWLRHALPDGAELSVRPPGGERRGLFRGMDEAGQLLLETERGVETILAGDVFLAGAPQAESRA